MKIFQVGGSVRDAVMGVEANDKDWVVVGSSPEKMIAEGFKPIGKDFPVFLHCLLYTSPSPRDQEASRMPSSA